jgi:hypothetical protein
MNVQEPTDSESIRMFVEQFSFLGKYVLVKGELSIAEPALHIDVCFTAQITG